ncbi:MAG: hypothetical protein ACKOXU_01105 [Limnohabitans sp.]
MSSSYLFSKIARHGASADRLRAELNTNSEECMDLDEISAIAFDAGDYVWTFLALQGYEEVQDTREIRNHVAQEIIKVLETYRWLSRG